MHNIFYKDFSMDILSTVILTKCLKTSLDVQTLSKVSCTRT